MEIYGPDLGMPHTLAMGQGVFYCTVVDRQIVMLHQFVKTTDNTPDRKLAIARRRMKELTNG